MEDSDLKSDNYTIGPRAPAGAGSGTSETVCADGKGNALFKVDGNQQFVDNNGKTIAQIKQGQQQGVEIYDDSGKLIGSVAFQQGQALLNDASNKGIASASKSGSSNGFNITSPDGKSGIATVTLNTTGNQGGGGGGLAGKLESEFLGHGLGMGGENNQNRNQQMTLNISVQQQGALKPLLLLAFAVSLTKLLGQGSGQKRGGMRSMGVGMLGGAAAGMLFGGLGGSVGKKIPFGKL
jgi:hypothetical protein